MANEIPLNLNLPSKPGILSGCEEELICLLTEVDLAVKEKHQAWEKQLQAAHLKVISLEKNNESLAKALENAYQEVESFKETVHQLEKTQIDLINNYDKQVNELKQEISKVKKYYEKHVKKEKKKAQKEENSEMIQLRKIITELESQISILQEEIKKRELQQQHAEASHERLLAIITEMEKTEEQKDNALKDAQSNVKHLLEEIQSLQNTVEQNWPPVKHPDLKSIISTLTEDFIREENACFDKLKDTITQEMNQLEQLHMSM
ncbi:centrosomal protein of 63 kDa-like [Limulus polyphemus]|uniref:Centrosomal protein of 63 kDa-like n=1 Tax=Limulus polyphemus TaxID=6850 RepID=A0ABM1BA05_LIMPO|nr:centrosomal protein of 63 kDa-like [Limulus polyphemus]